MSKRFLLLLSHLLFFSSLALGENLDFKVLNYEIESLKLGMKLEKAMKVYKIDKVNTIRDSHKVISGYEYAGRVKSKRMILNFTGEKRLYNIHYYNRFPAYNNRPQELFDRLIAKYGEPQSMARGVENIVGCWGKPCKRFSPRSPYLKAIVYSNMGKMELILYNKGLLEKDWKKYKAKSNQARNRRNRFKRGEHDDALDF